MKKNTVKISESAIRKIISETIKEAYDGSNAVTDPIGYKLCTPEVYASIMQDGFRADRLDRSGRNIYGPGFYFFASKPGDMFKSAYGSKMITVRVHGTYKLLPFASGMQMFVVPPEDEKQIEILDQVPAYNADGYGGDEWTTSATRRINESHLRKIICESIRKAILEFGLQ